MTARAEGTGWSRDGRRLWLAADHRRAYVGADPADVEAWPLQSKPMLCG